MLFSNTTTANNKIFKLKAVKDNGGTYEAVYKNGSYIYTACGNDGLRAYTFNGNNLQLAGEIDSGGYYYDVFATASYIYTACGDDGLRAYTFNGADFSLKDTDATYIPVRCVYGDSGNYVYAGTGDDNDNDDKIVAYTFDGVSFTYKDSEDDITNSNHWYTGIWGNSSYVFCTLKGSGVAMYSFDGTSLTLKDIQDDGNNFFAPYSDGSYIYCGRAGEIVAYENEGNGIISPVLDSIGDGNGIWGNDTYLFTAEGTTLYALTFDGNSFNRINSTSVSGDNFKDIFADEDYIYIADDELGLRIYSFEPSDLTPYVDSITPADGTEGVATSLTQIDVVIKDPEGDEFNWSIDTKPDIGNSSANKETNGTKTCSVTGLGSGITYTVYVNASDNHSNIFNGTYSFTTYGIVVINCYNESNPSESITPFYIEISNSDGSETYHNKSFNHGGNVGFDELPSGDNVYFLVNATDYKPRLYNYEIDEISDMTFNFYLYPDVDTTVTYKIDSIDNYQTDETVGLGCKVDDVSFVEAFNDSNKNWIYIPEDKWSLSGNTVTVDSTGLEEDYTLIRITYTCIPLEHYILNILDETNTPIKDAYINIERFIGGEYTVIVNGYSDGGGYFGVDLLPNINYRINITHDDYIDSSSFWTTPPIQYEQDVYKIFILEYEEPTVSIPDNPMEDIHITTEKANNGIWVNYTDDTGYTDYINITIYEYNYSTNTITLWKWVDYNPTEYFSTYTYFFSDINQSNYYNIYVTINHLYFGFSPYTSGPYSEWGNLVIIPLTNASEIGNVFDNLFGTNPFGWHNFIMYILMIAVFFYADERNSSLILILAGGLILFVNIYVGFSSSIGTVAGGIIPSILILFGIINMWNKSYKGVL